MKRITKLEISNFRAFYDNYEIELSKGENLLIYGENGSGKSSLFKSVSNFLSSSQDTTFPYIKHHSKDTEVGNVTFTFNDYDLATNTITSAYGEIINFGTEAVFTNSVQYLKTAELTKGFLDYRILLAVYNHSEAQPNLFQLIVEILLKEFIPTYLGGTHPLGKRFKELRDEISTAKTKRTWQYRNAISEMVAYENMLRSALDGIFLQLNDFLTLYFDISLDVAYSLKPLVAAGWWRNISSELKLDINLNGKAVVHQSDYLNEARLSALAICLYLSILKRNSQLIDFKVLFLDDVFIGLDLSNRLPILDIIKNEFSDYQVFISTYDRHLYEIAKRKFATETPGKWKSVELYVGKDSINNQPVDRPILVVGQSNFEKGSQYLHDRQKPDYPAAANYFRKALEELINEYIPKWETADVENTQIAAYKLGTLIYKSRNFLYKTGNSTLTLDEIISFLPTLLHPLSHHEITAPIYKGEISRIETLIQLWSKELKALDIKNKYRSTILKASSTIQIKYILNATTNKYFYFILKTSETIVLINDGANNLAISGVKNSLQERWGEENNQKQPHAKHSYTKTEKKLDKNNFISLEDAYERIYDEVSNLPGLAAFPKAQNYLDAVEYLDENSAYQPITNLIVW